MLSVFGRFLQRRIRKEDVACRYGGKEFTLILPDAALDATDILTHRLADGLKQLRIEHDGSKLGLLTASMGIAVLPQHGDDAKTLLALTDAALYRAKREGRDRICIAEVPT
ncbi:MAG: diguanylate cyclase [Gammaproteobacteria bacterium]|nr:diguanylate cyclase [Gammaproteobacteria bacterium]